MGQLEKAVSARPAKGEFVSGDVAVVRMVDGHAVAAVADVLGHGRSAHAVATIIDRFLREQAAPDVVDTLIRLDTLLQGTLGAAVALCSIDLSCGRVSYMGIGNVTVRCMSADRSGDHEFVPRDGIVGVRATAHRLHAGNQSTRVLERETTLLLYSDGIRSAVRFSDQPGIVSSDMSVVAQTVVEHFGRLHDDATCLALRYRP